MKPNEQDVEARTVWKLDLTGDGPSPLPLLPVYGDARLLPVSLLLPNLSIYSYPMFFPVCLSTPTLCFFPVCLYLLVPYSLLLRRRISQLWTSAANCQHTRLHAFEPERLLPSARLCPVTWCCVRAWLPCAIAPLTD